MHFIIIFLVQVRLSLSNKIFHIFLYDFLLIFIDYQIDIDISMISDIFPLILTLFFFFFLYIYIHINTFDINTFNINHGQNILLSLFSF
jgi:hypothetical protein